MSVDRFARLLISVLLIISMTCTDPAVAGGMYVQAEIGRTRVDDNIELDSVDATLDDSLSAARLAAGYQINKFLAVEVALVDLGDTSFSFLDNRVSVSSEGREVAAIGYWPMTERFSVGALVGVLSWDADLRAANIRAEASENDGFLGVTLKFDASDRLGIVSRLVRYQLDDLDTLYGSIGLQIRF